MSNLVLEQFYIFIKIICGGIFLGFMYDLYRVFRYYLKPKRVATIIEDAMFFILASIIVLFFLFYSNSAELRWYIFLGFLIGGIIYKIFLSKFVVKFLVYIMNIIIKFLRKIISIIIYPLKKIIGIIKNLINKALNKSKKGYKRRVNRFKKKFKNRFRKKQE